jgi:hypothetical protein
MSYVKFVDHQSYNPAFYNFAIQIRQTVKSPVDYIRQVSGHWYSIDAVAKKNHTKSVPLPYEGILGVSITINNYNLKNL